MPFFTATTPLILAIAAATLFARTGNCWGLSENRRLFPWKLAIGAVIVQAVLVLALFGVPAIRAGLAGVGQAVDGLSASTQAGVAFVFGFLAGTPSQPYSLTNPGAMFVFAFRVLPVILVVCALAALLWLPLSNKEEDTARPGSSAAEDVVHLARDGGAGQQGGTAGHHRGGRAGGDRRLRRPAALPAA